MEKEVHHPSGVSYNPITGVVTGKRKVWKALRNGYLCGTFLGKIEQAHRVAWFIYHGVWPEVLDHVNGIKSDNRLCNLREATLSENSKNTRKFKNNTSGHKGVSYHKDNQKWCVRLRVNGVYKRFGSFEDSELGFELACLVSDEARSKYHGSFSNNG